MESITTFNNLTQIFIIFINAGGIFRIIWCLIVISTGDESARHQMKKRIRNIIIALIVANLLMATIIPLGQYYFS